MVQLVFNDNFDNLREEPINYWKTIDDIPPEIKDFITNISNSRVIYD